MPFELVSAALKPPGSPDASSSSAAGNADLHPLDSIPLLHSNPSARAKLYLDFDGNFEAQWGGYTNVTTPVYDSDGDLSTFSDAELQSMFVAWSRVASSLWRSARRLNTVRKLSIKETRLSLRSPSVVNNTRRELIRRAIRRGQGRQALSIVASLARNRKG
jgi:hypothetical protein